jgi:hypothetical protein
MEAEAVAGRSGASARDKKAVAGGLTINRSKHLPPLLASPHPFSDL